MYLSKSQLMIVALGFTALAHSGELIDERGIKINLPIATYNKLIKKQTDTDEKEHKQDESIGTQCFINTDILQGLPNEFQLLGDQDKDPNRRHNMVISLIDNKEHTSWCPYSLSMTMDASKTTDYHTYTGAKWYQDIYQRVGLTGLIWTLSSIFVACRSTESLGYSSPTFLGTVTSSLLSAICWYASHTMSGRANEAYNRLTHNGRWRPGEEVPGTGSRPRIPKKHAFITTQNLSDFSPAAVKGLLVKVTKEEEINEAYKDTKLIPVLGAKLTLLKNIYKAVTGCAWHS